MNEYLSHNDAPRNYMWVEGSGDTYVFRSLLNYHRIIDDNYKEDKRFKNKIESFDIEDKGGIDDLLKDIEVALKRKTPYRRYGVIIDADDDCLQRWERVRHVLLRSHYSKHMIPKVPQSGGFIIRPSEGPAVGAWIMPNNNYKGRIEDFIGLLRRPDDVLWPIAENIVQEVMKIDCRFPTEHEGKARLHT